MIRFWVSKIGDKNQIMYNREFFILYIIRLWLYIIRVRLSRKRGGNKKRGQSKTIIRIFYDKTRILNNPILIIWNGGQKSNYVSLYRWILIILKKDTLKTQLELWHFLFNEMPILTPPKPYIIGKLRLSAFHWYRGLGVADRVFLTK